MKHFHKCILNTLFHIKEKSFICIYILAAWIFNVSRMIYDSHVIPEIIFENDRLSFLDCVNIYNLIKERFDPVYMSLPA